MTSPRPKKKKGKVTQFPQQKGNGKTEPPKEEKNATLMRDDQIPYLLPAQARAELITYLDSLALSGRDSVGRHTAISFLNNLKQIKPADKK